ncbi:hypothetical protein OG883_05935 [Streptomyces sp. NBC_01142]|uniref:hypothetical protein n=1 Tax=Streptomyces sp. NBC_01142 TaxID=2975865 RepID=UPI0022514145|nr:hypothetical protein [Streptomyces sp. NBC_01142]MCX4819454.1 hypothetical protein [Streptomyces sp. NBC_01142]
MTGLPFPVREVRVRYHRISSCGPFAHFTVDFEPPAEDGGAEFLNTVPEELLPAECIGPLRAGIEAGLEGVAAAVLLTEGRFHETDSSEYGYRLAGRMAGRAALIGAGLLPAEEATRLPHVDRPGRPRPKDRERAGSGRHATATRPGT